MCFKNVGMSSPTVPSPSERLDAQMRSQSIPPATLTRQAATEDTTATVIGFNTELKVRFSDIRGWATPSEIFKRLDLEQPCSVASFV